MHYCTIHETVGMLPTTLASATALDREEFETQPNRGAEGPPPRGLESTIFSGFLPLNYAICIF